MTNMTTGVCWRDRRQSRIAAAVAVRRLGTDVDLRGDALECSWRRVVLWVEADEVRGADGAVGLVFEDERHGCGGN